MTDWPWPHFTREEMACKCGCGRCEMDRDFMWELEVLRHRYGQPMIINSAYRCPAHNCAISDTSEDGPHTTGKAVDVAVNGYTAWNLLHDAIMRGWTGIGVGKGFLHLDRLDWDERPNLWSY